MKIFNRKVREGPTVPADSPQSTRSDILRGARDLFRYVIGWGHNDTRPGITQPSSRVDVTFTTPQATTSGDTGFILRPHDATAGATNRTALTFLGTTSTQTPGFGKLSPSGTGLADQKTVGVRPTTTGPGTNPRPSTGNPASLGSTTTVTPGFGKLTPSWTGIPHQREKRRR